MNAGRNTRQLPGWAIAAMTLSAVIVLLLAGAAIMAFFTGHGVQNSNKNDLESFNTSNAVALSMNNEPTGPNAQHIKEVDAQYPLADKITVYDEEGERMALADLDPESYDGFAAYMTDAFVNGLGANMANGTQLADGITYVTGNVISASSLEQLAEYVDTTKKVSQDDIVFVEPSFNLTIIDEDLQELIDQQIAATPSPEAAAEQGLNNGTEVSQMAYTNDTLSSYQSEIDVINARGAWKYTKGSDDVVVAVMDGGLIGTGTDAARDKTGAKMKHEDIDYDNHVVQGYNFIANNYSTEDIANTAVGNYGHGTFVTGQIIATADNGVGVAGLASGVKVAPYKVFDVKAVGSTVKLGTTTAVYQALMAAADNNVDVVNMSLGWEGNFNQVCYMASQRCVENGTILVAAAGNSANNASNYPAAYETVIGVSATNRTTGSFTTSYSNFGENNVVVSAPGTSIQGLAVSSPTSYRVNSGTSMAAPVVSAVAALAKSVDKSIDTARFYKLLKETSTAKQFNSSTTTDGTTYDNHYGWGVVNAGKLIETLQMENNAGITYPTSGLAGEACWALSSEGNLDVWPVTPNGRTYWTTHEDDFDFPWEAYASDIKSVTVDKGVNVATHEYYTMLERGSTVYALTYDYRPTLEGAFEGLSNCETFDLSGLSADASVPATDMLKGCTEATQIAMGSNWNATTAFPEHADGETAFVGWKVASTDADETAEQVYTAGTSIPQGAATYVVEYAVPVEEDPSDSGNTGEEDNLSHFNHEDPNMPAQLSVTMPLDLRLSFGNFGLSKVVQKNKNYGIVNSGTTGMKVVDVEMVDANDDFDIDAIYQRGESGLLNYAEEPITKNTIMLVYNDGNNYTYIGYKHPLSAARKIADGAINDKYEFKGYSEVTIPAGGQLKISFKDSISFVPTQIPATTGNADPQLCRLVYTVAAA